MSSVTLPRVEHLPALLLVEPRTAQSARAEQLRQHQYCVTQTDCALDIFLMQHMTLFAVAVLSDQVGTQFLCSAAQNVRWQWPLARIVILGAVPTAMSDQLYDEAGAHCMDEKAFLAMIDKLAYGRWRKESTPLSTLLQSPGAHPRPMELRESDPAKLVKAIPPVVRRPRDLPSDFHRPYGMG